MAAIIAVPFIVALIVALFAWPTARLEPRDMPVGVAGPSAATQEIEEGLGAQAGAFDVHRYEDEAAAREAIEDREVYGAFVATPGGAKLLTASGASQMVAQQLTHAASAGGEPVQVEDVVPASRAGMGLPSAVLPLVIAGIITGLAAATLAAGVLRRAGLVVTGAVLSGLGATAIIQSWLDVIGGDWFANAAVLSLMVMSIAAVVAGFEALLGKAGITLGSVTMMFVGNPFSAAAYGPEMLPQPVGELGQLLPPGAGANLLRSTGFFDGAAAGGHVAVLAAWALLGFGALAIAAVRVRRPIAAPAPAPA
jgi:ABC-2 family transporter protein